MEWKTQGGDDDERDSSAAGKGEGEYRNTKKLNEKEEGGEAPVTELVTFFLTHTHVSHHQVQSKLAERQHTKKKKVALSSYRNPPF